MKPLLLVSLLALALGGCIVPPYGYRYHDDDRGAWRDHDRYSHYGTPNRDDDRYGYSYRDREHGS